MAETDAASSTDNEWLLLRDALELVMAHMKSRSTAQDFLLSKIGNDNLIRCRYWKCDGERSPGWYHPSPPEHLFDQSRDPLPTQARFWQPIQAAGESIEPDWENSCVHWTAAPRWIQISVDESQGFETARLKRFVQAIKIEVQRGPENYYVLKPPADVWVHTILLHRPGIIAGLRGISLISKRAQLPAPVSEPLASASSADDPSALHTPAPVQTPTPDSALQAQSPQVMPKHTKAVVKLIINEMNQKKEITAEMRSTKRVLAKAVAKRMSDHQKEGKVRVVVGYEYIEHHLKQWRCWPLEG
jgi:hypothetical protein